MDTNRWGPFTGRQLTTMVVALIVAAVFVPTGVWAVKTASSVKIEDATNAAEQARVENGRLKVDTGLTATPATPSQLYYNHVAATQGAPPACLKLAEPPAGKALIITALHVRRSSGTTVVTIYKGDSSDACANPVESLSLGVDSTQRDVTFPSGLAIREGAFLSGLWQINDNIGVSVFGYLVDAAACETGCN